LLLKKLLPLFRQLDSIIAAILGFYFVQALTRHGGIGVSPDSIMYTSVARNLTQGNGFLQFDAKPLTMFPVAFPYFLHIIMLISGKDIIPIAPIVTGLLFAATILLAGFIIEKAIPKYRIIKIIALLLIITNPALLEVFSMLWSETLFIFLITLFSAFQVLYLKNNTFTLLFISAIIAGIAAITRYAGITVIASGCFITFFAIPQNWKVKWIHTLLFGCISSSFLIINLLSNFLQSGYLTGKRLPADTSLLDNLQLYGSVITGWIGNDAPPLWLALLMGLLLIVASVIFLLFNVFSKNKSSITIVSITAASFLSIYVLFILVSSTLSNYDDINNRLLSPVVIAFFTLLSIIAAKVLENKSAQFRLNIALFFILSLLALTENLTSDKTSLQNNQDAGIGGYAEDYWKDSEILYFLKTSAFADTSKIPIYSNDNAAIYYFTGKHAKTLPELTHERELDVFVESPTIYVIWLNSGANPDLIEDKELKTIKNCKPVFTFADGIIYECTPIQPPILENQDTLK